MENSKNLSSHQLMLLTVILILFSGYIVTPPILTPPANQDIWIVEVLSIFYTLILGFPLLFLSRKFYNKTPIEFIEILCGKFLGKILGSLYVFFMIFICILVTCSLCQFIGSTMMPETPYNPIIIILLATGAYGAYKGVEALVMSAEFFTPIILCFIIVLTFLNKSHMDFSVFFPVLADSNFTKINIGMLATSFRYYDIILLFMFVPNLKNKNSINKIFCYSIIIATIFLTIITVSTQAVLGIEQSKRAIFPYFLYSQQIDLFDFIQRIESLNVIGWFLTTFIKISCNIYAASLGMKQIFNTKSYRKFIIPIVITIFIVISKTSISKSSVLQLILSYKVLPCIASIFMFIIPSFLLIIYFFRRKQISCN